MLTSIAGQAKRNVGCGKERNKMALPSTWEGKKRKNPRERFWDFVYRTKGLIRTIDLGLGNNESPT